MSNPIATLADLRDVRHGVSRALLDMWKGARLIRDGEDITEPHKGRLQELIVDLNGKIAAHESSALNAELVL
jgi:hypothetical protein